MVTRSAAFSLSPASRGQTCSHYRQFMTPSDLLSQSFRSEITYFPMTNLTSMNEFDPLTPQASRASDCERPWRSEDLYLPPEFRRAERGSCQRFVALLLPLIVMIVTFHILFLVLKEFYGVERVAVPKTSNSVSSSAPNPKHQETLVYTHNDQQQRCNPEHRTRDPRKRPRPSDRSAENERRDPYDHQPHTTTLSDAPVVPKRTMVDDSLSSKVLQPA